MTETTARNDDPALEWTFANARQYSLLCADEERAVDKQKWLAIKRLQDLLAANLASRAYLAQWATNLVENPPGLDKFLIKEHYYLLRREQADYQAGGKCHESLLQLRENFMGFDGHSNICSTLQAMDLQGPLVVGMAEIVLQEEQPRGVAAALSYWHACWLTAPTFATEPQDREHRHRLREQLTAYYQARDKLVNHNLRLVFSIAGHMKGRGLPYRDLIQDGVVGLIRAAEKFQYQKGYRFSTYAYNWIKQATRRANDDLGAIIRYPAHVNEQISRMHRERSSYRSTHGREPGTQFLAQRLDIDANTLEKLRQVGNLAVSTDQPIFSSEEGPDLGETIAGGPFDSPSRSSEQASLHRCLMERIAILEPAEQRVVVNRWGLQRSSPQSRADVARQMNVSTEWVRQLEASALAKLGQDNQVVGAYRDHADLES